MVKVHTREKKKYGMGTHLNGKGVVYRNTVKKPNRPQTYKHEETAHKVAETSGLKKDDYVLVKQKRKKKFQIVKNK